MNDFVCDKQDCPMYGHFFDMRNYTPLNKLNEKYKNESDIDLKQILANYLLSEKQRFRLFCSQCKYFERPDMMAFFIKEKAKELLKEGSNDLSTTDEE